MADIKAADIIAALGGAENIDEVEGCITRLRVEVEDGDLVDKAALQAAGAQA
ncbi:MAG: PTS transporter subunit EIIB, partial [Curtobacterium sp.]